MTLPTSAATPSLELTLSVALPQKCGGISYLAEDKAAILKEREAAAKK